MQVELLVLRVVHVLGAIFWLGGSTFTAFYLMPAIQQSGAAGGQVLQLLVRRKIFMIFPIVAIVTMLAGIRLMMITSGGFRGDYFASPMGRTYAVSAILAIIAFLLGTMVARPAMTRAGGLSQMSSSDDFSREKIAAEIKALQSRARVASMSGLYLLWVAAIGMAVARYL
jgi:uncharacterized membrane protein